MELIRLSEAASRKPTDERIPGLLDDGLVLCVAPEACGKTFLGIHMGVHIASGHPWKGRPVEQGAVVYCIAEGVSFFPFRVTTAFDDLRRSAYDTPFFIYDQSLNLRCDEKGKIHKDVEMLCDAVATMEGQHGVRTKLIVFDTLNRYMPGGDENDQAECGGLVEGATWLKRQLGCTVMLMHHMRKDGKAVRGNTVLTGAADQILVANPTGEITDSPVLWTTKGIGKRKDRDPIEQWMEYKVVAMSRGSMHKYNPEADDVREYYVFPEKEVFYGECESEWVEDDHPYDTLIVKPCEAPDETLGKMTESAEKVLALIKKTGPCGISYIMRNASMAQRTAYRSVDILVGRSLIKKDPDTGKYSLVDPDASPFEV